MTINTRMNELMHEQCVSHTLTIGNTQQTLNYNTMSQLIFNKNKLNPS